MAASSLCFSPEQPPEVPYSEMPLAQLIPEDELVRHRVMRLAHDIGQLATAGKVEYDPAERENTSIGYANLMEAVWFAAQGEVKAQQLVETNARTHIVECLMKAGIFDTTLHVDSRGRLVQNGQLLEEVYENALRWSADGPEMQMRTQLEIYNGFLVAEWARLGLLDNHRIIVFSPYPTSPDMTDERARELGFFPETKTCAIQSMTKLPDGSVVQEVAFVAATTGPNSERYDLDAIRDLLAEMGASIDASSSMSILGTPIAVPQTMRLTEIVARYDQHASQPGERRFFGQAVPVQDYELYVRQCRQCIADLEPLVQAVVADILLDAATLRHPVAAIRALHDVAQRHMVAYAFQDPAIDERVFGPVASAYIEVGRQALAYGDQNTFLESLTSARSTAQTGSCPIDIARGLTAANEKESSTGDSSDECEFTSKECPKCRKKNVKTIVTRTEISGDCGCRQRLKAA